MDVVEFSQNFKEWIIFKQRVAEGRLGKTQREYSSDFNKLLVAKQSSIVGYSTLQSVCVWGGNIFKSMK